MKPLFILASALILSAPAMAYPGSIYGPPAGWQQPQYGRPDDRRLRDLEWEVDRMRQENMRRCLNDRRNTYCAY